MELQELYDEIVDDMNERFPFFTTHFLKMGEPRLTDPRIPAPAYVAWDPNTKELNFYLDPEFTGDLDPDGRLFVCMHETFHVLLRHNLCDFVDKQKGNIATDIVINDYLVDKGMTPVEGLMYGEAQIGINSVGMTAKEVYEMLPDPEYISMEDLLDFLKQNGGGCGHGQHEDGQDGESGQSSGGVTLDIPADVLEELANQATDVKDIVAQGELGDEVGGKLAGKGQGSEQDWLDRNPNVKLDWLELLRELDPDLFKDGGNMGRRSHTFNKLHRKVAWAAPKVVLPVPRPGRRDGDDDGNLKPTIVLAIDTSGSISRQTRNRFLNLALSIPTDRIDLECCSFTDYYKTLDLENVRWASGGTNFSAIEEFIQDHFVPKYNRYPGAVVVFTDGEAWFGRTKPPSLENWHWLIDGGYYYGEHGGLPADIISASKTVKRLDKYTK